MYALDEFCSPSKKTNYKLNVQKVKFFEDLPKFEELW